MTKAVQRPQSHRSRALSFRMLTSFIAYLLAHGSRAFSECKGRRIHRNVIGGRDTRDELLT